VFTAIADGILKLPPALALALVFLLPLLEASAFVGFVIPGEIGVLLGGVLANQHKLPLAAVLAAGILGAVIGDSIGYEVGRRYGERLLHKLPRRLVKPEQLQKAQQTVRTLGGKAVFVGRFTTALRVLIPGFAGMSGIPYLRFLAFNVAGGVVWATGFILLGYAVGSQYPTVEKHATQVGWAVLGLVVVAVVVVRLRHRHAAGNASS
jgi:undecaprenyl-diphosphatase